MASIEREEHVVVVDVKVLVARAVYKNYRPRNDAAASTTRRSKARARSSKTTPVACIALKISSASRVRPS